MEDATIDAKVFGLTLLDGVPTSIQQGTHTSPIWYKSEGWVPRRQREAHTTQKEE